MLFESDVLFLPLLVTPNWKGWDTSGTPFPVFPVWRSTWVGFFFLPLPLMVSIIISLPILPIPYRCCLLTCLGWYLSTEIARDFFDTGRYNLMEVHNPYFRLVCFRCVIAEGVFRKLRAFSGWIRAEFLLSGRTRRSLSLTRLFFTVSRYA